MQLADGCYRFYMYDLNDDGLYFYTGTAGSASLMRRIAGSNYGNWVNFNPNFGRDLQFYFAVNNYNEIGGVGIAERNSITKKAIVFPNPAQSTVYVEMSNIRGNNLSIAIYDVFGKQVLTVDASPSQMNTIPVENLSQGIYFILVKENDVPIARNKFIISR
jgi:hypothetical protein